MSAFFLGVIAGILLAAAASLGVLAAAVFITQHHYDDRYPTSENGKGR